MQSRMLKLHVDWFIVFEESMICKEYKYRIWTVSIKHEHKNEMESTPHKNEMEGKPHKDEREGKPYKEWKDNHEHAYHCLNCVMFPWYRIL
jgi:hypothetical protein